ncbi:MAG: glycosyltransferase family 4 protein [Candidatus Colwellbacteria bacterium]|jgi:glycosyltransferase involved in cell wall biosynthesis|nr:glycosyltransferase family 4 protein [Candidatus Colwellbacteria bacterium]MCK9497420.1 glycosyltransferase family 4 protein [Candidatus Colwellbacteria bacterium]MDD3752585.1 glycosyltransferase family 4 protein [Candidatus Colwellbacteria bacterium]MDD4818615.1 glycosyltransferase family 4 protein [Candidatus Colwellbacteria bacterium]
MKILSNDYLSNIPGAQKPSKGGPAVFANNFSSYACREGYYWNGIIIESSLTATRSLLSKIGNEGLKSFYKLTIPYKKIQSITKAEAELKPRDIFEKEIKKLTSLIRELDIDLVFLNGFSIYAWILLVSANKIGVPIAIQHAGVFSKEIDVYSDRFSLAGAKMLKEMEKESSTLSDKDIFLNEWSRDYYINNVYGKVKKSSVIIPLPFSMPQFNFRKKQVSDKIKLGSIARWDRIKNHLALLRLAKEIQRQNLEWQISSVTKIPDTDANKEFKKIYREKITVLPAKKRREIFDFIRSADMMLVPSLFDVSPNVVLESIYCGTPVLISETVGFSTLFKKKGASDYVADFKNSKEIINKIKKLKDKPLPKRLVRYIKTNHNPEIVFKKYLKLFERLSKLK